MFDDGVRAGSVLALALGASIGCAGGGGRAGGPDEPQRPQPVPVLHVAIEEPGCRDGAMPCGSADVASQPRPGVPCSNGSLTDCNLAGTTLIPGSAWVDPAPPKGWQQCAGFVNTALDDVTHEFLDHCLGATRLRIRVFGPDGRLEEDVLATDSRGVDAWPAWNYLLGSPEFKKKTHWGATTFFATTDGRDACMKTAAPGGTTFGSGNANVAIVAGGNAGADEYRINCEGASLPGRTIGLYRDPGARSRIAQ
jgi:hypothetical protein